MQDFSVFNIIPPLSKAINELGFTAPTPIQEQALPTLLGSDTDFLGLAATGTGKTAAYGIPLLSKVAANRPGTEAIILCPTRELAKQITESLRTIGKYMSVQILPIYGGAGYDDQIRGLKQGAHIVVATPGRLIDHLKRGTLNLAKVHTVILDEADEMISMGFSEDLQTVFETLKSNTPGHQGFQTWLFSATMQPELRKIADRYLKNPVVVQVNQSQMLSGTVEQIYYTVREEQKAEVVCRILDVTADFHGLVFCQTKALVDEVENKLRERGYASDQLHGDRSQTERERTLRRFKKKEIKVLVCTDVAARGLDVKNLSHVINFSIPRELDSYVHRIGRTGRSGVPGIAISLVTPSHFSLIGRIEKMTRSKLVRGVIPTGSDVVKAKIKNLLTKFLDIQVPAELAADVKETWSADIASLTPDEIISRFLTMLHPEISRTQDRELGIDIREQGYNREDKQRSRGFFQRRTRSSSQRPSGGGGSRPFHRQGGSRSSSYQGHRGG